MQNEYIKKSEVIELLTTVADSLKDYSAVQHPIAYGIRIGVEAMKDYIENFDRGCISVDENTKEETENL